MLIAKNRIFSEYSSRNEKICSIILNIQVLAILALGVIAYNNFTSLNSAYCVSCILCISYTIVSYLAISDNKQAHIGSSEWYASNINFKPNLETLESFVKNSLSFGAFICVYLTFITGASEGYFETKYLSILALAATFGFLSIFSIKSVSKSKVSESGIYLIDKVDVFDEEQKSYFKACMAEKIRKKGYVTKKSVYNTFKIINEIYLKRLAIKEKQDAVEKDNEEKKIDQKEYENLLTEYKKPLAYIVKN